MVNRKKSSQCNGAIWCQIMDIENIPLASVRVCMFLFCFKTHPWYVYVRDAHS